MDTNAATTVKQINRRASRRVVPRGQVRIECRKGTTGLGRNLALRVLDLSETGMRLLVNTPLDQAKEVEVVISGTSYLPPIKRIARVVRNVPNEDGTAAVGLHFSPPLDYANYMALCSALKIMR